MRILIFGASGKTGRLLTQSALQKNYQVTAFVRSPDKFPYKHPALSVFKGNVIDYGVVSEAVKNHDAVLCALGAKTPFKNDPALITGIRNIVKAMEKNMIKRFIYLSFLGAHENREELGFVVNQVVSRILKKVIEDHEAKEKIITGSNLEWTIVRPPRLTQSQKKTPYRHGERILPNSLLLRISRTDLADFMVDQITDNQYIRKKPRLMY